MEYRILGKTGLKISRLGFGGIPIQKTDREQTRALMHRLMASGVNYIDTARSYTVSEEYLGYALEGIRQHFILATKSMARDAAGMEKDIGISLRNLRTDYIDLYQLHNPSMAELAQITAPGGALETLEQAKADGRIHHIGITAHSLEVFETALEYPWVETIMFPYNIVENQGEDLIRRCGEKNIGFIVMKPLAGGAIEDGRLALRYILQNPDATVVIPGMAQEREIAENVAAANDPSPLSAQELASIQAIRTSLGSEFCRRCNYCAPCTAGIPIPAVFLIEGYLSRYGLEDWARMRYDGLAKHPEDCIDCGICETRCPYHLPIRQMLRRAAEKFRT